MGWSWASAGEEKRALPPMNLGLGTLKGFCERPFALKPEKDKQNVYVALP